MDRNSIVPNYISIHGFDNIGNKFLGVIKNPNIDRKFTLETLIHVMPHHFSYNIFEGLLILEDHLKFTRFCGIFSFYCFRA